MSSSIVRVRNLVKWYGPRPAVQDVSFSVDEGEVVGLLGPNGSGKSTIFRILTGYLAPSSGTAEVAGCDVTSNASAVHHQVGYVPEDAPLYAYMRTLEFLRFMARLKGLTGRLARSSVDAALARLQLGKVAEMPVAKLSRGYRQRVAIAQALLNEPKLLVFDEPTAGLDPNQVIAIRDLVRALAGKQTVLIASHVLSEIQQIATRVMILLDGKLLTADALREGGESLRLRLQIAGPGAQVHGCLAAVPGVRSISCQPSSAEEPPHYLIEADPRPRLAQDVAATLLGHHFELSELVAISPDLEQVYLDLTRSPREAAA
jgi:ABC-2 type transport system ATP-binding protein